MTELVSENGRVVGIVVTRGGGVVRVAAREGVLLGTGGFSRSNVMRHQHHCGSGGVRWTVANPGDTGEVISAAQTLGAAVDLMDTALWAPSSFRPDGRLYTFHAPNDTGKPHCIVVDREGRRFANESQGYVDFGRAMIACNAVPSWAILDSRHRKQYPWGMAAPGRTPQEWVTSGYMKRATTLVDLAQHCGMISSVLTETVRRFNHFADKGIDDDCGRGQAAYDRLNSGDPTYVLNPSLGGVGRAPFYAVPLWPADVGTQGGLVIDDCARVLRDDGTPILGVVRRRKLHRVSHWTQLSRRRLKHQQGDDIRLYRCEACVRCRRRRRLRTHGLGVPQVSRRDNVSGAGRQCQS